MKRGGREVAHVDSSVIFLPFASSGPTVIVLRLLLLTTPSVVEDGAAAMERRLMTSRVCAALEPAPQEEGGPTSPAEGNQEGGM